MAITKSAAAAKRPAVDPGHNRLGDLPHDAVEDIELPVIFPERLDVAQLRNFRQIGAGSKGPAPRAGDNGIYYINCCYFAFIVLQYCI